MENVVWSDEYYKIVETEKGYLVVLPDGEKIACVSLEEAKSIVEHDKRRRQRREAVVYSEEGFRVVRVEENGSVYFIVIYPGGKEVPCASLEEAMGIIRQEIENERSRSSLIRKHIHFSYSF